MITLRGRPSSSLNRAVRRWIEEQASIIPPGSFQASFETVLVTASGGGERADVVFMGDAVRAPYGHDSVTGDEL